MNSAVEFDWKLACCPRLVSESSDNSNLLILDDYLKVEFWQSRGRRIEIDKEPLRDIFIYICIQVCALEILLFVLPMQKGLGDCNL